MSYNLDVKKITKDEWSLSNCKERAMYIISNYNKTEKQLRDKLKQSKKYSEKTIDETIKFLKKHNYINDRDFALRFVELYKGKYSKKVLNQKLYLKGIDKKIIDEVLAESEDELDSRSLIRKTLLKKYPNYYIEKDDIDIKESQKVFAYLFRKGFPYEDVEYVLRNDS